MIRVSPLQVIGIAVAVLLIALGIQRLQAYGKARYEAGRAEVQADWDKAKERGRKEIERLQGEAGKVTVKTETVYVDRVRTIREKGDAIVREVPVFIPAGSPDLPGGFRLLHDAAAGGESVPDAADLADAAPVPAQDAASTVAANYAQYLEVAARLTSLQDWVREQCRVNPPPAGCSP